MVAARLIAAHPHGELIFATSDKWRNEPLEVRLGPTMPASLRFIANAEALTVDGPLDAVLLATPVEVSFALAAAFRERGVAVIDLSGAFRLKDAAAYPRWYRVEHPYPQLLAEAHYGLPELTGPAPRGALVANPGCYPTASLLALAPLVRAGLVEREGIVIDAKSGVTGAGRRGEEAYAFVELDADLRAYRALEHQHTPEIAQALAVPSLTFQPHLLPISRGLYATAYGRPKHGATAAVVAECLRAFYARAAFVDVVPVEEVRLREVVGTNRARVAATADKDVVIAVGAIDNLVKGAAGQAVQNLNLMFGLPEAAGLDALLPQFP
jgi:N-acetyl-gamma-glutamyl-phosphate reductase